ncbi:carboxyl-terminal protease [Anaeromyxobacter sp. Fw109-5]|nr:carboxyl-terminal protease [Anaeromyxobacter sp. Fw109-5]
MPDPRPPTPRRPRMIRPFRLLTTLAATAALALGVTVRFVRAEPDAAPAVAYRGAVPAHAKADAAGEYRLDRLPILSQVILKVKDNYVDPARFDPKKMVVASLESVERAVAEVMVQGDEKSPKLTLTVGSSQRDLDLTGVDSIWKIRLVLGEAMGFIQDHLVAHKELKDIEYAAVAGLLSTLDPHTNLLEPKYFKEMKLQTRGEFGGLGFVIAMRDGNLTVVKVLKNTPAQRAGIKAKDVIARIEEQSTVNMDLQDAVDRLRGKPQTKISITVQRKGAEARKLSLLREVINVETVAQAKLLEGNVGYVRLSQFSANTTRDLLGALQQQRAQAGGKLEGLVLDLRGNPGGLLEQAIQVSDLFLSQGVIVKTVGGGDRQRIHEVKEASSDASDLATLPLVVIVNNSSASASEIVAGALKNNDRALVIGRQTFGKGSVQVLDDLDDPTGSGEQSALKLTIAQYLTPGDLSIQEVGITPDVLLLPGRALKEQVNFFAPPRSMGEADLDGHLMNPGGAGPAEVAKAEAKKRRVEKAPLELRYLLDEKEDQVAKALKRDLAGDAAAAHEDVFELTPEQVEDEEAEADPDRLVEDYQIRFARELLKRAPQPARARLMESAKALVAERQAQEDERLEKRLRELGVDWTAEAPAGRGTPRPVVTLTPAPGKDHRAGETVSWTVTVENKGDAPFRRLRAWTTAEKNALLDRREFVFGNVPPGQRRSWTVPLKLPKGMDSRRDEITLHFEEDGGHAPADLLTSVGVVEVAKPVFAFSVQIDDRQFGNGDGLAQRGETFDVRLDVRNAGTGAAGDKTWVSLKNLGDEKLFVKKGRESLGALKPGETKSARMEVELRRGSKSDTLPIRVMIVDEKMEEYVSEKLDWPIAKDEQARTPASGAIRVEVAEATLRSGASAAAPAIATARRGALMPVDAKIGEFFRVEWQKGRFAFVPDSEVRAARGTRSGTIAAAWQREPPRIALVPDPQRGAPVVEGDSWKLQGSALVPPSADPDARLRDVFVFVNEQKVFFKVLPEDATTSKLDFSADIPLQAGNNVVTVFAREDDEFQSRRSIVVYRRPPAEVAADGTRKTRQAQ